MTSNPQPVEQLERQADREREQLNRRVAEIRYDLKQRLDVRRNAEEQIRDRPGAIYGVAAGVAALFGYIFARLLKA